MMSAVRLLDRGPPELNPSDKFTRETNLFITDIDPSSLRLSRNLVGKRIDSRDPIEPYALREVLKYFLRVFTQEQTVILDNLLGVFK